MTLDLEPDAIDPFIQVGSALLQTTYDGDALVIEALGSSGTIAQVKVSHRPVETAALALAPTATSLLTSTTAGRPRRTTAAGLTTFHLDVTAPVGASGLLIKGPGDINVMCDGSCRVRPGGRRLQRPPLLTDDFDCQGVMGWEVVAPNRYLITGQTSLSLADPLDLETGDIIGVLQPVKGGTGVTSIQALHTALEAIGFEPLYPDLPAINASAQRVDRARRGREPGRHDRERRHVDDPVDWRLALPDRHPVPLFAPRCGERVDHRASHPVRFPEAHWGRVTIEFPTGSATVARQNLSEIFLRVQSSN